MENRPTIADILAKRKVQLDIAHDHTTLDNVAEKMSPLLSPATKFLGPLMSVMRDTYAKMGMKSSAAKTNTYQTSYERVIAATALSVNRARLDLQEMLDIQTGGYFEVALAATMRSGEGHISVKVEEVDGNIQVSADSVIPGQVQAWGRGTAALDAIFEGIEYYLKIIP